MCLAVAVVTAGCASGGARRIDPAGPETVVSINQIDIQDWADAADSMLASLIQSNVLARAEHSPAVIAISRITNGTTQHVDTAMLTGKIRSTLSQSGQAVTSTTIGLGGRVEDPLAQGEAQRSEFFADGDADAPKRLRPDFTLSGRILEDRASAGRTRQTSYVFQLALTDTATGVAVWEDEETISKQGTRNAVGW